MKSFIIILNVFSILYSLCTSPMVAVGQDLVTEFDQDLQEASIPQRITDKYEPKRDDFFNVELSLSFDTYSWPELDSALLTDAGNAFMVKYSELMAEKKTIEALSQLYTPEGDSIWGSFNIDFIRGFTYLLSGYDFDAVESFQKAADFSSDSLLIKFSNLVNGTIYMQNNMPIRALNSIKTAISYDKSDPFGPGQVGYILDMIEKKSEAEEFYKLSVSIDSSFLLSKYRLGCLYQDQKRSLEAIQIFQDLLHIEDDQITSEVISSLMSSIAYSRLAIGSNEEALEEINKAIKLNGNNSYAFRNRALVLISTGKLTEACRDINSAIDLGYEDFYGDDIFELQNEYCIERLSQ